MFSTRMKWGCAASGEPTDLGRNGASGTEVDGVSVTASRHGGAHYDTWNCLFLPDNLMVLVVVARNG